MAFPTDIATTTVHGTYYQPTGEPAEGLLIFTPTAIVKNLANNIVISDDPIYVELDGKGSFSVTLPVCQADLVPDQFLYNVSENFNGSESRNWDIRLDEAMGASVALVSLSPAVEPDLSQVYPTLGEVSTIASNLDALLAASIAGVQTQVDALNATLPNTLKTGDLGVSVAPLVNGKIPNTMIPPISVGNVFTVASQSAMLALAATRGDLAVRTDVGLTFILSQDDATVLANWVQLLSGAGVTSVNGKIGTVNLNYIDVGAAADVHTHSVLSMTSLVASSASFTTMTSGTVQVGATGTSRHMITANADEWYDATNVRWLWIDRATKRLELTSGTYALGASTAGRFETAVPSTSTAGTVTTTTATQNYFAKNGATAGITMAYSATYDTSSSSYTASTLDIGVKAMTVSGTLGTGALTVTSPATGTVPNVIKGIASQSANLTEWRNSSNSVLASMSATGSLDVDGTVTAAGKQLPFAFAAVTVTATNLSGASVYTIPYTWPVGRFTQPPIASLAHCGGTGSSGFFAILTTAPTTTGGNILVVQRDAAVATITSITLHVTGIQMTSGAAAG